MCPQPTEDRDLRRAAVRRLLATRVVRSQFDLEELLKKQGFVAGQSSLSRDLRDLRVAKVAGRYVLPDASMRMDDAAEAALAAAAPFVLDVRPAGPHLLVVKTTPGGASPVGLAIDRAARPEVVGTVAGDDTLFVAVAGRGAQAAFAARLKAALDAARQENPVA